MWDATAFLSSLALLSLLQRKSSKAKEKKQKRLEERAAMDAVCAKVEAANRVTDSWAWASAAFGTTAWQTHVTTGMGGGAAARCARYVGDPPLWGVSFTVIQIGGGFLVAFLWERKALP